MRADVVLATALLAALAAAAPAKHQQNALKQPAPPFGDDVDEDDEPLSPFEIPPEILALGDFDFDDEDADEDVGLWDRRHKSKVGEDYCRQCFGLTDCNCLRALQNEQCGQMLKTHDHQFKKSYQDILKNYYDTNTYRAGANRRHEAWVGAHREASDASGLTFKCDKMHLGRHKYCLTIHSDMSTTEIGRYNPNAGRSYRNNDNWKDWAKFGCGTEVNAEENCQEEGVYGGFNYTVWERIDCPKNCGTKNQMATGGPKSTKSLLKKEAVAMVKASSPSIKGLPSIEEACDQCNGYCNSFCACHAVNDGTDKFDWACSMDNSTEVSGVSTGSVSCAADPYLMATYGPPPDDP